MLSADEKKLQMKKELKFHPRTKLFPLEKNITRFSWQIQLLKKRMERVWDTYGYWYRYAVQKIFEI